MSKKLKITKRQQVEKWFNSITEKECEELWTVAMVEINGRIYAKTYPGPEISDDVITYHFERYGYGKNARKGFRPYDQSRGCYLL